MHHSKSNSYRYREDLSIYKHDYVSLGECSIVMLCCSIQLCNVILSDATKRTFLSEQLKQQLKDKRMVFSKNELQLTSTVGQGIVMLNLVVFH